MSEDRNGSMILSALPPQQTEPGEQPPTQSPPKLHGATPFNIVQTNAIAPGLTNQAALPGAELARQRQARGWTIPEVADQLNLATRQITAIENDDYATLPGIAIVRGFVRAYAKLLKIDPVPLLATMPANPTASLVEPTQQRRALPHAHFSEPRLNGSSYAGNASKWYSALLIAVALIGAIALGQHFEVLPIDLSSMVAKFKSRMSSSDGDPATSTTSTPGVSSADNATANVIKNPVTETTTAFAPAVKSVVVPSANIVPPATVPAAVIIPAPPASQPASAIANAAANAAQSAPSAPLALNPATALAKAAATGDASSQLVLNLRDDSWIEIRGTRNTVASKLYRAGTTEIFDITEPVQLIIGNAAGVDATLRGAPLALQTTAKNNVARLNLK